MGRGSQRFGASQGGWAVGASLVVWAIHPALAGAQPEVQHFYEWIGIEMLPGYSADFGEPDALAGISENGRYMWSQAAADPTDADEPYLVIDRELHYTWEFEGLSALLVNAINSNGLILATALEDGQARVLITHIQNLAARTYLDEMEFTGDPGLDPSAAVPLGLTDTGAVLVQTPVPETDAVRLWIVRNREVSRLWETDPALAEAEHLWQHLAYAKILIDTNASDTVLGYRGLAESEIRPVLWSPQTGVMELSGFTQAASINDDGTVLGAQESYIGLWRDGDIEWDGYGSVYPDGQYGTATAPAGRAADGVRLRTSISRGSEDSTIDTGLSAKSPYDPVTLLEVQQRPIAPPATITEAGFVLDGRAGWFEQLDTADAVTAIGGARAFLWADRYGYRVATRARRDRTLRFSPDDYGGTQWYLGGSNPHIIDYFDGDFYATPWGTQNLVYRDSTGLHISVSSRTEFWGRPEITSRVTGFSRPNNFFVVAGTTETGELRLVYDNSVEVYYKDGAYYSQADASLSDHLALRGLPTPDFASNLDSFITPWGAMNIVGLDHAGDLHAVWWSPALRSPLWTTDNLSAITGAPKLVGNISANATHWNGMQVFGADERGHLIVVWWSPVSDGWHWDDLTAETGGTPINPDTLAALVTPWNAIEVVATAPTDEVVSYWWTPRSGGWRFDSITDWMIDEVPPIAGPLSFAIGADGTQHIAGVSADGEVIHIFWIAFPANIWRGENLTERATR